MAVACKRCGRAVATYGVSQTGTPSLRSALDRHGRQLPPGPVHGRLVCWCSACGERAEVATATVATMLRGGAG